MVNGRGSCGSLPYHPTTLRLLYWADPACTTRPLRELVQPSSSPLRRADHLPPFTAVSTATPAWARPADSELRRRRRRRRLCASTTSSLKRDWKLSPEHRTAPKGSRDEGVSRERVTSTRKSETERFALKRLAWPCPRFPNELARTSLASSLLRTNPGIRRCSA